AAPAEGQPLGPTLTLLKEAQEEFNTDRKLAASIERAGNVVLPILFVLEAPRGRPDQALAPFIRRNAVSAEEGASPTRSSALAISALEGFGNAAGAANMFVTPVHPAMPAVALQAQVVSSLLQEHFFAVPAWARLAELGTLLAVALYLVVVLPRLSAGSALAVTTAGLAALIAAH